MFVCIVRGNVNYIFAVIYSSWILIKFLSQLVTTSLKCSPFNAKIVRRSERKSKHHVESICTPTTTELGEVAIYSYLYITNVNWIACDMWLACNMQLLGNIVPKLVGGRGRDQLKNNWYNQREIRNHYQPVEPWNFSLTERVHWRRLRFPSQRRLLRVHIRSQGTALIGISLLNLCLIFRPLTQSLSLPLRRPQIRTYTTHFDP